MTRRRVFYVAFYGLTCAAWAGLVWMVAQP
jgi:hypothetical protein